MRTASSTAQVTRCQACVTKELDRHVAIELIQLELADHPDFARRFISETRTAACLRHANIPQIYTTDRAPDGRFYMVMERVRGITLPQAIDLRGRVPLVYLTQAVDAVACAHAVGIVPPRHQA